MKKLEEFKKDMVQFVLDFQDSGRHDLPHFLESFKMFLLESLIKDDKEDEDDGK